VGQLPVGKYEISLNVQGFKTYTHSNLSLIATQTLREDIALQIGSSSEAVTVTAESSLLRTEGSELAHNVTIRQLDNLPILPVNGGGVSGLSSPGFRDPFSLTQLIPGTSGRQFIDSGQQSSQRHREHLGRRTHQRTATSY
jgi:hypothetical protein